MEHPIRTFDASGKKFVKLALYAAGAAVVLGMVFLPGHFELKRLREDNQEYQRRMQLLEDHNAELEEELLKMQDDPEYLERRAREKLGIVKKGEIIYRKKQNGE